MSKKVKISICKEDEADPMTYYEATVYLNDLQANGYFDGRYPVCTPVSSEGYILFNGCTQLLKEVSMSWIVNTSLQRVNYKDNFVWVPTERKDLMAGDTAYHTNHDDKNFYTENHVNIILDDKTSVSPTQSNEVNIIKMNYTYWYKLTKKENV